MMQIPELQRTQRSLLVNVVHLPLHATESLTDLNET